MKFALIFAGAVLGGLFINDKFEAPHGTKDTIEIVYGHRVGPDGNMMLVTK